MSDLTCPKCGAEVPAKGISSATGLGIGGGEIALQPYREHATCESCGAKLERNVEPPMDEWRLAPGE